MHDPCNIWTICILYAIILYELKGKITRLYSNRIVWDQNNLVQLNLKIMDSVFIIYLAIASILMFVLGLNFERLRNSNKRSRILEKEYEQQEKETKGLEKEYEEIKREIEKRKN